MKCQHVKAQPAKKWIATKAWPLIRWDRGRPRPIVIAAYKRKLKCARSTTHRASIRRSWKVAKREFREHRKAKLAQRERLRYLPYACGGGVRSAIDCAIMLCESGGSYTARNPSSTAGGKYQIIDLTWYDYGGSRYVDSHPAAVAPPAEQDRVASAIWAGGAGRSAWVC